MMLDVVKTHIKGRASHDSLSIVDSSLDTYGIGRLVEVSQPTWRSIFDTYKHDDWDVLMASDYDDLATLFMHFSKIFSHIPIIVLCCATGISSAVGESDTYAAPFIAAMEVSRFLCATEVWMISQHLVDISLEFYSRIFSKEIIEELVSKIRVAYLGIDCLIEPPKKVGHSPRIAFLHRPQKDKGIQDLLKYLTLLQDIPITLVTHRGKGKVWGEIENVAKVEYVPYLGRDAYFDLLRSCDIVFSSALHENFGLAVLESVALGSYPILPNRLSYSELFPASVLYDTIEEAAILTRESVGNSFDNHFVEKYLWENVAFSWRENLERVYRSFYSGVRITPAGQKMVEKLSLESMNKMELMKWMGWSSLMGWGRYRHMVKENLFVSLGPDPIYGNCQKNPAPAKFSSDTQSLILF